VVAAQDNCKVIVFFTAIVAALSLASVAGLAIAASGTACLDATTKPDHTTVRTCTVTASDGVCLRAFAWQLSQAPVRGVVVITHGIRDSALRCDGVAR
jgi:hypothetical protein